MKAAFEALDSQAWREGGPNWGAKGMAAEAWAELAEDEKRRILNGWTPRPTPPSAQESFGWIAHASAEPVLRVTCGPSGEVVLMPDVEPCSGIIRDAEMIFPEGTDKATAVASARAMLLAVERHYEAAIRLTAHEGMNVLPKGSPSAEPVEQALAAIEKAMDGVRAALQGQAQATAGGQAAPSGMLPAGTLIRDPSGDDAGFVVGGFKGTNGILYIYVNAAGEVNSQYSAGVKVAEGNHGGLPTVTDASGGDPLAGVRGRLPEVQEKKTPGNVRPVVDMKGRKIVGKQLARRVPASRRRARVAAAA